MAVATWIGDRAGHGCEEGVAGAERDDDGARRSGSHADERRRVVAGGENDLAIRGE